MTTIGMNYDVLPGKEAEFEHGFISTIDHLRTVHGHVESHLYKNVAAPASYLILSQWNTREDFDAFIKSDAFRKVTSWGKAEILSGRPRHKVYSNA